MTIRTLLILLAAVAACSAAPEYAPPGTASPAAATSAGELVAAPAVDHHQHLFSPAVAALLDQPTWALDARDLVAMLDSAGIRRAVVMSLAYQFGRPSRRLEDEYGKVRAENDWTSAQVAQYPDRLIGFCGLNPLKEYAVAEVERCARDPNIRHGLKMHFGNSDVQLENPEHLEQLKRVFRAANANRMALAIHLRASISLRRPYGREQARLFIEELLPLVPDVPVQVAHLASSGPGYRDPAGDSVMSVLAEAIARRDPRTARLYIDVATSAAPGATTVESAALVVRRIRQVGVDRILYGSDGAVGDNLPPRESWAGVLRLPLTDGEFTAIARNVAPYLRQAPRQ